MRTLSVDRGEQTCMKLPIYIRPQEDMFQLVDTDAITIAERLTFENATALQTAINTPPAAKLEMAFPQTELRPQDSILGSETATTGGLTALAYIATRAFPVWLEYFLKAQTVSTKHLMEADLNEVASQRAITSAKALLEELSKY